MTESEFKAKLGEAEERLAEVEKGMEEASNLLDSLLRGTDSITESLNKLWSSERLEGNSASSFHRKFNKIIKYYINKSFEINSNLDYDSQIRLLPKASMFWAKSRDMELKLASIKLNLLVLSSRELNRIDTYEDKKQLVKFLNSMMRGHDAAIAHPVTGNPNLLLAIASYDKRGRYTLEDRATKKRSGSYKTLREITPFKLVPDIPRREGVIERRKKKGESEDPPKLQHSRKKTQDD